MQGFTKISSCQVYAIIRQGFGSTFLLFSMKVVWGPPHKSQGKFPLPPPPPPPPPPAMINAL